MKALKVILTVILTILIIFASISTVVTVATRTVFANPNYYRSYLPKLGTYDAERDLVIEMIMDQTVLMDITPQQSEVLRDIMQKAVPKDKFNVYAGNIIGDAMDFILHNRGEANLPFRDIYDEIIVLINEDERLSEKEADSMSEVFTKSYGFITLDQEEDDTLRGFLYTFFDMDDGTRDETDEFLDVTANSYLKKLNIVMSVSVASLLVLLAVLYLVTRKDSCRFLMILKGINVFYLLSFILSTLLLTAVIVVIPMRFAGADYWLTLIRPMVTDLIKSVLYLSAAMTVVLILLQVIYSVVINISDDKAHELAKQQKQISGETQPEENKQDVSKETKRAKAAEQKAEKKAEQKRIKQEKAKQKADIAKAKQDIQADEKAEKITDTDKKQDIAETEQKSKKKRTPRQKKADQDKEGK